MRISILADRNRQIHTLWALFLLSYTSFCYSEPVGWNVQPKVCIVKDKGDVCELELTITTRGLPAGEYCFFQDSSLILCKANLSSHETITIRFSESTRLQLRAKGGEVVLSHDMQIKARESNRTRRVRQPWSLF
ncbi:DUF3019 domain-containing protein [Aliiglaciecola litoralis]|uniref:DUF3019 domain-containing protein n=1 Tax=Aliiglaciecola litoralis TaxID=582857 RepID=A0ABP3WQU2_9ALTE